MRSGHIESQIIKPKTGRTRRRAGRITVGASDEPAGCSLDSSDRFNNLSTRSRFLAHARQFFEAGEDAGGVTFLVGRIKELAAACRGHVVDNAGLAADQLASSPIVTCSLTPAWPPMTT